MKFKRKGFAKKDNVRTSESTAAATWNPFTFPFEVVLQVRPEAHANRFIAYPDFAGPSSQPTT